MDHHHRARRIRILSGANSSKKSREHRRSTANLIPHSGGPIQRADRLNPRDECTRVSAGPSETTASRRSTFSSQEESQFLPPRLLSSLFKSRSRVVIMATGTFGRAVAILTLTRTLAWISWISLRSSETDVRQPWLKYRVVKTMLQDQDSWQWSAADCDATKRVLFYNSTVRLIPENGFYC